MIELARRERLGVEARAVILAVLEARMEDLHGDRPPEHGVHCAVDLTACAAAEQHLEHEATIREPASRQGPWRATRHARGPSAACRARQRGHVTGRERRG